MKCPLMTVLTRPSVLGTSALRRSPAVCILGVLTDKQRNHRIESSFGMLMLIPQTTFGCGHKPPSRVHLRRRKLCGSPIWLTRASVGSIRFRLLG